MKINNFRGDLTDISAKKEALVHTKRVLEVMACCDPRHKDQWKTTLRYFDPKKNAC